MVAPMTLSRRASFWVSAAVVVHTLWTSAAPAVTYPLYAAEWHLTTTETTSIFAIYPIAVVASLLLFGNLSDFIGRRAAMLWGLSSSLCGALFFAIAPSLAFVCVGRTLMGIGVGLSASPAAAALVEFGAPGQTQRSTAVATAASALGVGLAMLVGGALVEYAPFPTHLNFWVLALIIGFVLIATCFLPRPLLLVARPAWRPSGIGVPRSLRLAFASAATAVTASFTLGALLLSLGTQIARDLIGSSNALVDGAAISLFALVSGAVAIAGKQLSASASIAVGGVASALGMGLLVVAASDHQLAVFLLAVSISGVAYSLLFLGGLTQINLAASANNRGGVLSMVYLVAYVLMGFVALALGVSATRWGLQSAVEVGAPLIGAIGLLAVAIGRTTRPDSASKSSPCKCTIKAIPGCPSPMSDAQSAA